jgi:hypothetical protein
MLSSLGSSFDRKTILSLGSLPLIQAMQITMPSNFASYARKVIRAKPHIAGCF